MIIKKKYLDDDTREELKNLKGVVFNSEEELNEKLDEIHRKRNNRTVSRIMRLLGFLLALVLFFAAFDVYFESSFLGAIFTKEDYKFSLESMKQSSTTGNGTLHRYIPGAKCYVLKDYDLTTKSNVITEHEWNSKGRPDDYCEVYVYTIYNNGMSSEILSPDVSRDWANNYESISSVDLKKNYEFLTEYPAPETPLYDDWWWFGTGFVAFLNTIIILGLGILLVYISVFMIKDFVDAAKFTFIGTRNSAAELIETASGAVKRKKKDEEEAESVRSNKKLFDDEESMTTTPKKKKAPKKIEEPKDEEKKETQPLYNDDDLDRLLKGENISTNTETETEPRRRSLFDD